MYCSVKYFPSSLRCTRIKLNETKKSDLLKENSVLLKVFSVLPEVILEALKDHNKEIIGLCGSPLVYTVYIFVRKTTPQYRRIFLQIRANSVRNIHNHAKVEKTSATCNNKRRWFVADLHVLRGLKHGMGDWWLVKRTISLSCKINWYFMVIYIWRLNYFF